MAVCINLHRSLAAWVLVLLLSKRHQGRPFSSNHDLMALHRHFFSSIPHAFQEESSFDAFRTGHVQKLQGSEEERAR